MASKKVRDYAEKRKRKDLQNNFDKRDELDRKFITHKTRHWVLSIVCFAFFLFFTLASLGKAGVSGRTSYDLFFYLFGFGYFLIPLIFLTLCIIFIRAIRPTFVPATSVGASLFFVSGLSIIGALKGSGGIVGNFFAQILIKLFDFWATIIILIALMLISVLFIFDSVVPFEWLIQKIMFWKKQEPDTLDELGTIRGDETSLQTNEEITPDPETKELIQNETTKPLFDISLKRRTKRELAPFTNMSAPEKDYVPPPLSLLEEDRGKPGVGDIKANANIIKRTLQNFGIDVEMDEISVGPSVTRYALKPAQGVKLAKIVALHNDLALALAAHPIRIEAPIPGKSLVGIEIPNNTRTTVGLGTLLAEEDFGNSTKPLLFSLGRSVTGKPYFGDLAKMPHLLIAGATGSGKSVAIHTILASLLYRNSPENLRFMLIDPKRVELTLYNAIPHLLTPVITEYKKAILALKWATKEMERRYDVLEKNSVRDIESYHKNKVEPAYNRLRERKIEDIKLTEEDLPEKMPYVVIVIDELADIMTTYPRELESAVVRLAQMSRAVGIHLILSTQRPSVNIITGLIKANVPARMAFQVPSQTDSRTVLDMSGAEKLLGAGDMLYLSGEMSKPIRLQESYVSESEVKRVVKFLHEEHTEPRQEINFAEEGTRETLWNDSSDDDSDQLYEEAREMVVRSSKASTTYLQRKLKVGYARAARLMDILEERGVVGRADGSKPREVLIKSSIEDFETSNPNTLPRE